MLRCEQGGRSQSPDRAQDEARAGGQAGGVGRDNDTLTDCFERVSNMPHYASDAAGKLAVSGASGGPVAPAESSLTFKTNSVGLPSKLYLFTFVTLYLSVLALFYLFILIVSSWRHIFLFLTLFFLPLPVKATSRTCGPKRKKKKKRKNAS